MSVVSSFAVSAWSGASFLSQASRRAQQVTAVTLTRTDTPGTRVQGAEITVPERTTSFASYANPLLTASSEKPMTGTDLARVMVDDLRTRGTDEIDASRAELRTVMAEALGIALTDDVTLSDLRDAAATTGDRALTSAADSFAKREASFDKQMGKLDAALSLAEAGTQQDTDSYVHKAIRDVVEMRLAPEKLDQELQARRGAAILQLTGASDELQNRALSFRRAAGAAALQAKRANMVKQMTNDWQEGRISAVVTSSSVWAGQTASVDSSQSTGTTVTYREEYNHFASASVSLAAGTLFQTTLGRL